MPVSRNAIDLIMRLLEERQDRLSTKRYRENDWVLRDKATGTRRVRNLMGPGHIVFPNDAEDIKSHPFFRNIQWSALHMTRPPFVPRVHNGQSITKYFDEEHEILSASDHLDSSSYEAMGDVPVVTVAETVPDAQSPPAHHITASPQPRLEQKINWRKREKKRPRDKLLRDVQVGRTVLELRKKGAFVGYTYRRPGFSLSELDEKMVGAGPHLARASALESITF